MHDKILLQFDSEQKYFKTLRTSETGKKLELVFKKMVETNAEVLEVLKEHHVVSCLKSRIEAAGGVYAVRFEDGFKPDPLTWKEANNGYVPRKNTKSGRAMHKLIKSLPVVYRYELNECVGFDGFPFLNIGVRFNHPNCFIFWLHKDWDFSSPSDCDEVSQEQFYSLIAEIF